MKCEFLLYIKSEMFSLFSAKLITLEMIYITLLLDRHNFQQVTFSIKTPIAIFTLKFLKPISDFYISSNSSIKSLFELGLCYHAKYLIKKILSDNIQVKLKLKAGQN